MQMMSGIVAHVRCTFCLIEVLIKEKKLPFQAAKQIGVVVENDARCCD